MLWRIISDIFPDLLTLIAILATVLIYFAEKKVKGLSVKVVSNVPILDVTDNVGDKLQILFDNKRITNANLLIIEVSNNGNTPIAPSDFVNDLQIVCNEKSTILNAEVHQSKPSDIKLKLSHSLNVIHVKPTLLNKGDTVLIKALAENFDGKLLVNGRIIGISKFSVKIRTSAEKRFYALVIGIFLALMVNYSNLLVIFPFEIPRLLNPEYSLFFQIISFLLLFYAAGIDILFLRIYKAFHKSSPKAG